MKEGARNLVGYVRTKGRWKLREREILKGGVWILEDKNQLSKYSVYCKCN
ncbi:hypothetical protein OIU77_026330, partial [Salix suchowensis]